MKPIDALHNWDIPELNHIDPSLISKATSGLLNKTFLIKPNDQLYILQCVHPAVSMDGAMNNYFHVTHFLQEQGMTAQTMLTTKVNTLWIENGDHWRWRLLKGVEGQIFVTTADSSIAIEGGRMLGQFHTTLSQYNRELEVGRLSFRYQDELEKLSQFEERLSVDPDEAIREATHLLLTEFPKLMLPDDLPQLIIHGDPKISNFIFSAENKAVCMIDLDTIQKLSPLFDLGDAIRSWCGFKEDDPSNSFNTEIYSSFMQGYLETSKGLLSEREQTFIPQAAKLIMLGLTTRFLNDYVEDSYFGWDETKYESRKAHNKARVVGQLSLYKSAVKALSN